jgi:hypothetical protein
VLAHPNLRLRWVGWQRRRGRGRRSRLNSRTAVPTRCRPGWDGLLTYRQGPKVSWTDALVRALTWDTGSSCVIRHSFEGPEGLYWTDPLMRALACDTRTTCEHGCTFRSKERLHGFRRELFNVDQSRLLPRRTTGVAREHPVLLREIGLRGCQRTRRGVRYPSSARWPRRCRAGSRSLARRMRPRARSRPHRVDAHHESVMNCQDPEAGRGRESELAQDARALHTPFPFRQPQQ